MNNFMMSNLEYDLLTKTVDKLYKGNRGADCPSTGTKALRLLGELKSARAKIKELKAQLRNKNKRLSIK